MGGEGRMSKNIVCVSVVHEARLPLPFMNHLVYQGVRLPSLLPHVLIHIRAGTHVQAHTHALADTENTSHVC